MTSKPNTTPNPNSLDNVSGEFIAYHEGKLDAYKIVEQEYKEDFGESRYKGKIDYMTSALKTYREALSNNNGSGNTTAPMPSPDLGEGKEK